MRALCIQQPWAGLIADGRKTVEVRSWSTPYRGPVVVVASRRFSVHEAARRFRDEYYTAPRGVTICLVDLIDVRAGRSADSRLTGGVDPTGLYAWVLSNARALHHVSVRGQLNLFTPQFHIRLAS